VALKGDRRVRQTGSTPVSCLRECDTSRLPRLFLPWLALLSQWSEGDPNLLKLRASAGLWVVAACVSALVVQGCTRFDNDDVPDPPAPTPLELAAGLGVTGCDVSIGNLKGAPIGVVLLVTHTLHR
jgi:hypothetical protein